MPTPGGSSRARGAESGVHAVRGDHVRYLTSVTLGGSSVAGHDGGIRVIAALIDVSIVVGFRLALVARILAGGPNVAVRYVPRLPGLGECVDPVVVFVENFDALSLAHGQLLVAARRVVADSGHAKIRGTIASGFSEHFPLECPVVRSVAGLVTALVTALVARGVRGGAVVAGRAGAVLIVLQVTLWRGEGLLVVVLVVLVVMMRCGIVVTMVSVVPVVTRLHDGDRDGGGGAALAYDRLLQLLRHGCVANLPRNDLVEHLHAGRQHKVSLAALACRYTRDYFSHQNTK